VGPAERERGSPWSLGGGLGLRGRGSEGIDGGGARTCLAFDVRFGSGGKSEPNCELQFHGSAFGAIFLEAPIGVTFLVVELSLKVMMKYCVEKGVCL
jgi:hypothetical protein